MNKAVKESGPWIIKGRCWVLGDNIATDLITPKERLGDSPEEAAKYMFEYIDPELPKEIKPGDFLVAGKNFGTSSSRIAAVRVLKAAGVGAVIAESFARIFYRNLASIGIPALICGGITSRLQRKEQIRLDVVSARIYVPRTGEEISAEPIPAFLRTLVEHGGIIPYLRGIGRLS